MKLNLLLGLIATASAAKIDFKERSALIASRPETTTLNVGEKLTVGFCGTLSNNKCVGGKSLNFFEHGHRYELVMQRDCNLVYYFFPMRKDKIPIWSSGTNGKCEPGAPFPYAILQGDGNFVIYSGKKAIWDTGFFEKKPTRLVLQADENIVFYSDDGLAVSLLTFTNDVTSGGDPKFRTCLGGGLASRMSGIKACRDHLKLRDEDSLFQKKSASSSRGYQSHYEQMNTLEKREMRSEIAKLGSLLNNTDFTIDDLYDAARSFVTNKVKKKAAAAGFSQSRAKSFLADSQGERHTSTKVEQKKVFNSLKAECCDEGCVLEEIEAACSGNYASTFADIVLCSDVSQNIQTATCEIAVTAVYCLATGGAGCVQRAATAAGSAVVEEVINQVKSKINEAINTIKEEIEKGTGLDKLKKDFKDNMIVVTGSLVGKLGICTGDPNGQEAIQLAMDIYKTLQAILDLKGALEALTDPVGAIGEWGCKALVEEVECGDGFPTSAEWWLETTGFSSVDDAMDAAEDTVTSYQACAA